MERTGEWHWILGGTVLLLCESVLLTVTGNVGLPLPAYRVILHFLIPLSYILVLPLAFWGTFGFLWDSKNFAAATLAIVIAVGVLNGWWIAERWQDGQLYQGPEAMWVSLVANAVGSASVVVLAVVGLVRRSRQLVSAAYLGMFVGLTWCAFPFLGSMES
jgi:predicted membrane protein